jgi:hypothetical protein
MRILAWDIELSPILGYTWSLWPNVIPINHIVEPQRVICFGARWVDQKKVIFRSEHHDTREDMLATIHELLDEADAVLSWNGQAFDSKHIRREFEHAGMNPPAPWKEIDLLKTARSQFKFASNKLDYVAQYLGVGQKVKHQGMDLWRACVDAPGFDPMNATWEEIQAAREATMAARDKAWRTMKRYQFQDVNLLVDLYDRMLPWIPTHPNVALYNDIPDGCKKCGSTNLQRRGYEVTSAGKYRRYHCQDCSTWQRGSKSVATTEMR